MYVKITTRIESPRPLNRIIHANYMNYPKNLHIDELHEAQESTHTKDGKTERKDKIEKKKNRVIQARTQTCFPKVHLTFSRFINFIAIY